MQPHNSLCFYHKWFLALVLNFSIILIKKLLSIVDVTDNYVCFIPIHCKSAHKEAKSNTKPFVSL